MIKKILIANRGEIALRIIRTCKKMGIKTVALCPQKGEESDFIETALADEFYYLEKEGISGYLDIKRILEIAKKSQVDAIHPGYGFLAENWLFAKLCRRKGIKFIGPNHGILKRLEDKIEAKKIAKKVKIPVLPFSQKSINSLKDLKKWVLEIRPPFVLKARKGGGGIGIRAINGQISIGEVFTTALGIRRQMSMAFSNTEFFLEKYLSPAKHIEVQIVSDTRNFVHLGERECSIQRRFQKLLEESPSIFLDKETREKIFNYALRFARALRYEGVGTIEFLVSPKKDIYFMEVNPRLQVEHPITEARTGIDLVEQQIRIAQGEPLRFRQEEIRISGHAIEARILAEDPVKGFVPSSGQITEYSPPTGSGISLHTFLHKGQKIYPYCDSLLAKLVSFGQNRGEAISRLKRALREFSIKGVPTTIPFFNALLEDKRFLTGNYFTDFIEKSSILKDISAFQEKKEIVPERVPSEEEVAKIVYQFFRRFERKETRTRGISSWKMAERTNFFQEDEI